MLLNDKGQLRACTKYFLVKYFFLGTVHPDLEYRTWCGDISPARHKLLSDVYLERLATFVSPPRISLAKLQVALIDLLRAVGVRLLSTIVAVNPEVQSLYVQHMNGDQLQILQAGASDAKWREAPLLIDQVQSLADAASIRSK